MKAEYNAVEKIRGLCCRETMAMWVAFLHTQCRGLAAAVLGCLFKEIWGAKSAGRESASTQSHGQASYCPLYKMQAP